MYIFSGIDKTASVIYDSSTLNEKQKARGILKYKLPEQNCPDGHYAVLMADKHAEPSVWWEYREVTNETDSEV